MNGKADRAGTRPARSFHRADDGSKPTGNSRFLQRLPLLGAGILSADDCADAVVWGAAIDREAALWCSRKGRRYG